MSSLSGFHLTSERFRIRFTADGKHQSGDRVLCTIIILQYLYKNIFVLLCQAYPLELFGTVFTCSFTN